MVIKQYHVNYETSVCFSVNHNTLFYIRHQLSFCHLVRKLPLKLGQRSDIAKCCAKVPKMANNCKSLCKELFYNNYL